MSRTRSVSSSGTALLTAALTAGFVLSTAVADDKAPQSPVEVYEWSVWVGNPALTTLNGTRVYRNAMPSVVGTTRPKFEDKELEGKFPVAPVSVVQFFGEACRDVDIDVRAKKGPFVAHWPQGNVRGDRLQWFGSGLLAAAPADVPLGFLPENHWFQKLRAEKSTLFLKHENNVERFIAYDNELTLPIPIKIRGGPDEYTLQNLTDRKLLDVAIVAPAEGGYRVGWLDELPAAGPDKKKDEAKPKKPAETKPDAVFDEAEAKEKDKDKDKDKEEPPAPLPPEGDATVRARVDQLLNRPVTVAVEKVPTRDVLDLITGQAQLRYDLDDRTIAKAEVKLSDPSTMNVANAAARDALADVLGNLGLSYRVTDAGKLFITTAARLAEDASKKGSVVEGPPVKLGMSQPLKASHESYKEMTRDTLARRLAGQGQREETVQTFLAQYGPSLFEPGELIVLAHLSRDAIDEAVLLEVFPPPKKLVRTALVVIHGVDPRLQDRARTLVKQLGDDSPKARDAAEARLMDLGPVAVPVLEDALLDKDVEVVFRAERLLLRLNRPVP